MKLLKLANPKCSNTLKNVIFVAYIALFLLLLVIFWDKGIIDSIINMRYEFIVIFLLGCIIAAYSTKLISKKSGIEEEINDEITLNVNTIKKNELLALLGIFLLGLFLLLSKLIWQENYLKHELGFLAFGAILLVLMCMCYDYFNSKQIKKTNKKKSKSSIFLYLLRFILEVPKLLFLFLALERGTNLGIIFVIIGLGSLFYSLLPRGIFLLDSLVLAIFILFNYTFEEFLVFILFSRFLGAGFIILLYIVAKFILNKIQKVA